MSNFQKYVSDSFIYYAVKSCPEHKILEALAAQGCYFDTATTYEIHMALKAGATPDRISYGNPIKKERDIKIAYDLGIRHYAVDCFAEVDKIARVAPGSKVFCRVLFTCEGAEWPLSRKFGCEPTMAVDVIEHAKKVGLIPSGVSFHVGSQQTYLTSWDSALSLVAIIFQECEKRGIKLDLINLGGGFPTRYLKDVPSLEEYGKAIKTALEKHFPGRKLETWIEPGRGMAGMCGVIEAEVVLISHRSHEDKTRWVYLDIGKFGGLAETMDESIRYKITTPHDGGPMEDCIIAGPTCDSADVLYEKKKYPLPVNLKIGDKVIIEGTGAYTATYSSVAFNGFPPLQTFTV
jgi:ornithine decarboxylase